MKKLITIIPLFFLLCFPFSCQQPTEEAVEEGLTEEEVNAIMGDVLKVWNNADLEACDRVFSADYVDHDPVRGDTIGLDAFKELLNWYYENFSSIDLSMHENFIKGNKVAGLSTWKATHISGAEVELSVVTIMRIEDGKIAEMWVEWDNIAILTQLGHFPLEKKTEE